MEPTNQAVDAVESAPHFAAEVESDALAWEEIEPGRFMPRRVRGSFRGRALG
jgi:hypothetical protein